MLEATGRIRTTLALGTLTAAGAWLGLPTGTNAQDLPASGTVLVDARGGLSSSSAADAPIGFMSDRRLVLAGIFRNQADLLRSQPDRWSDAAAFHYYSALLQGMTGEEAARDLLQAANLFQATGQPARACAALEKAASLHLASGRVADANTLFRIAARLDRPSCASRWAELYSGLRVPRPAPVSVAPPEIAPVTFRTVENP